MKVDCIFWRDGLIAIIVVKVEWKFSVSFSRISKYRLKANQIAKCDALVKTICNTSLLVRGLNLLIPKL